MKLSLANSLIDATINAGRDQKIAPLAVAVLDTGGRVVAIKRDDGTGILRVDLAVGKAMGALGMGIGTRALAGAAEKAPTFFAGAMAATGAILPSPGGILLMDSDNNLIGAIGVSGDIGAKDEAAAIIAIEAAELKMSL